MLRTDATFDLRLAEAIDEEFTDTKGQVNLIVCIWPWPHIPFYTLIGGSCSSPGT